MELPKPYYNENGITIYHGDCRDILPLLPKVDLVLTDPPYGLLQDGSSATRRFGHNQTNGSVPWDTCITDNDCQALLGAGKNLMCWGGNHFMLGPTNGWLIWDKENDGKTFGECEYCWTSMKFAPRIFRHSSRAAKVHPTQKPLDLVKWCIGFPSYPHTILDPFMGSGTTLRAAKDLGRQCIGIEIEEKYCTIAVERLRQEVLPLF